ncbi:WYL domain-containing protein [Stieleria sp. ICT_E10.1]|uniref:WYL domain-containing protein n=1 Tax=Stieleria sedimenti TaxID=2976331 RepID=UPI00218027E8|nr:WYL domain-containing protein [Stieleria sedimenti]MCS7465829.1 WYL domain-containing protein [Stieleria sedimenti]
MPQATTHKRQAPSKAKRHQTLPQKLSLVMRDPDHWVCRIIYQDRTGKRTARLVSPIRWTTENQNLLALCISREERRQFAIAGIQSVELVASSDVLMGSPSPQEAGER